jgi:hypothetical protein
MRLVAVSIAVVACWVTCSLAPAWAQSPQEGDRYDCDDFQYQEDAQEVYDRDPSDPYGLDGPIGPTSDGIPGKACEVLPSRADSGGTPGEDQYGNEPPGDVDNPKGVVPNTASQTMPNTGGPPYLAVSALLLLGAAVVAGCGVLRR